jgi:hypothetical protein
MAHACDDCGERVYGGFCTNCHEEVFIAQQYEIDGEPVPETLLDKIAEFEPKQQRIARDIYGE